jgi:hypothetical protein
LLKKSKYKKPFPYHGAGLTGKLLSEDREQGTDVRGQMTEERSWEGEKVRR